MNGLPDDDVNTSTGTWSNDSCGNQKTQQLTAEQQQQQQQQEANNGSGQPAALTPSQQAVAAASNRSISGSGSKNSSGQHFFLFRNPKLFGISLNDSLS